MLNRLIKNFCFEEDIRLDLEFSDSTKIRLNTENPNDPKIQLKSSAGEYPTDSDIFVKTPLIEPMGLKKWLKFEARLSESQNINGLPSGTSLGFKVRTSGDDYYWDGASWSVAGLNDWSTEKQISDNLETFPIATIGDRKIGFIINLVTTDPSVTPEVKEAKLAGQFDVEYLDDIVYDGLIRKLNTEFRSSSVLRFQTDSASATVDLDAKLENKGYNITGIKAVYNLIDDPQMLVNLFDSYTPGTQRQDGFTNEPGTVTLTASQPSGAVLHIEFYHLPEIMVRQHQDFFEVATFPSMVIENILEVDNPGFVFNDTNRQHLDYVRDKTNLTAIVQEPPRVTTLRFEIAVYTNSQLDQMRIVNDWNAFWTNNKFVKSYALDQKYGVRLVEKLNTQRNQREVDSTDTNVAQTTIDVLGVAFYDKPSTNVPLVGQVLDNYELLS